MSTRKEDVLSMQLMLVPMLAKEWKMTLPELSDTFARYDIPEYIDTCYESYNSTGNQGILDDLTEFVKLQGGQVG